MKSSTSSLRWLAPLLLLCLPSLSDSSAQQRQLSNRGGQVIEQQPYPYDGVTSVGQNSLTGTNWNNNAKGVNALTFHGCGYSSFQGSFGQYPTAQCQVEVSTWTEAGMNRGNPNGVNSPGWFIVLGHLVQTNCYSVGICASSTWDSVKPSGGDFSGVNQYIQCSSVYLAFSDEGCVGSRINVAEPGMMEATVATGAGGVGITSMQVNCTANCAMVGAQRPLINKTTGVLTATVTSESDSGGLTTLNLTGITLPAASVCGTLAADVQTPPARIDTKSAPRTISLTGLASALAVGQVITIGQFYIEKTTVSSIASAFSGGAQTITAPLAFPHLNGGFVCAGGLTGYAMETPRLTLNGSRQIIQVVSSGANSIVVTEPTQQGLHFWHYAQNSTINLYPSATVVNSGNSSTFSSIANPNPTALSTGTLTFAVEPNTATWNPGDSVELAVVESAAYVGSTFQSGITNPLASVIGHSSNVAYNYARSAVLFQGTNFGSNSGLFNHSGGPVFAPIVVNAVNVMGAGMVFSNYLEDWSDNNGNYHLPCVTCFEGGQASGSGINFFDWFRDDSPTNSRGVRYLTGSGIMQFNYLGIQLPAIKAKTGTRFVCVDTSGNLISQTTACSGT